MRELALIVSERAAGRPKYPVGPAAIEAYAQMPHPKRKERLAAVENLRAHGLLTSGSTFLVNHFGKPIRVIGQVKPEEICKGPDVKGSKPPRLVAALGACAALRGGHVIDEVKDALSNGYDGDGWWDLGPGRCQFVKSVDMRRLFDLYNYLPTVDKPHGLVFSDDGGWVVPTIDGMLYIKTDISGCDASIGPAVFKLFARLCPRGRETDWVALTKQTRAELQLGVGQDALVFKPVKNVMYSGWSGTTLIDTLFNMTIFNWVFRDWTIMTRTETISYLYSRVKTCGAVLTFDVCRAYEEFDFVKTFPALGVDGKWYPQVVLGVILRTYGQKKGRLPGRGSIEARGVEYQKALTIAMKHFGDNIITEAFRAKFGASSKVQARLEGYMLSNVTPGRSGKVLLTSVARRYGSRGVDEGYLQMVAQDITGSKPGGVVDARAILEYDYGYQLTDTTEDLYDVEIRR